MSSPLAPAPMLLVKLGTIVRLAQIAQTPKRLAPDQQARLASALSDNELNNWLEQMDRLAALPEAP